MPTECPLSSWDVPRGGISMLGKNLELYRWQRWWPEGEGTRTARALQDRNVQIIIFFVVVSRRRYGRRRRLTGHRRRKQESEDRKIDRTKSTTQTHRRRTNHTTKTSGLFPFSFLSSSSTSIFCPAKKEPQWCASICLRRSIKIPYLPPTQFFNLTFKSVHRDTCFNEAQGKCWVTVAMEG